MNDKELHDRLTSEDEDVRDTALISVLEQMRGLMIENERLNGGLDALKLLSVTEVGLSARSLIAETLRK